MITEDFVKPPKNHYLETIKKCRESQDNEIQHLQGKINLIKKEVEALKNNGVKKKKEYVKVGCVTSNVTLFCIQNGCCNRDDKSACKNQLSHCPDAVILYKKIKGE